MTLVLVFKKIESEDKTKKDTFFYSKSKTETIINESDINDMFKSVYNTIEPNIQRPLRKGSGWIFDLLACIIILVFQNIVF